MHNPLPHARSALQSDERLAALKRVPVLDGLPPASLVRLAAACIWRRYEAGTAVLGYQDTSTDVFFIVAGKARAVIYSADGKGVVFRDLKAGSLFGELAAIDAAPRSTGIEAVDACTIAQLDAAQFRALLQSEPTVAMATLRQMAADVRRLSERVHEFSTMVVQNRIQAELLRLADEAAPAEENAPLLTPAPALSDVAHRVATHREAVSRELSRLTALGILRRERGGAPHCRSDVAGQPRSRSQR